MGRNRLKAQPVNGRIKSDGLQSNEGERMRTKSRVQRLDLADNRRRISRLAVEY
jgi:hypothetical protein